jgi:MFS-type transporter involved in bile tolerance (Atg22 family)
MRHNLKLLIGCLLPLLVIFLLPLFGLGQGFGLFLFIVLMFAGHLLMLMMDGHDRQNHQK